VSLLVAALAHVPFDGFTDSVLLRAAQEKGVPRTELKKYFPDGPLSLVEAFSEWADGEMLRELGKHNLKVLKIRERIAFSVTTRLAVLQPYKEAARRAAAFLSLPPHAATGAKLLYRTVDAIWRAIGDTSPDFNFYTKRAILAGVYSTTMMRWFSDTPDGKATTEFLRRRIDDVMKFEKFKADIREHIKGWPGIADFLNPDRRGSGQQRSKARGG
jgi:ubiquinone biosynthesis protein COQ9